MQTYSRMLITSQSVIMINLNPDKILCLWCFYLRSASVEFLTCTDNVQAWGISKAEKQAPWGAKRISELCCVSHPPKLECKDEAKKEQILAESFGRILLGTFLTFVYPMFFAFIHFCAHLDNPEPVPGPKWGHISDQKKPSHLKLLKS